MGHKDHKDQLDPQYPMPMDFDRSPRGARGTIKSSEARNKLFRLHHQLTWQLTTWVERVSRQGRKTQVMSLLLG